MASVTKLYFEVSYTIATVSLERSLEALLGAVDNFPWPKVIGVESPVRANPTKGTRPKEPHLARLLEQASTHLKNPGNFTLHFGENSFLSMGYHGATSVGLVSLAVSDNLFEDPTDCLDRLMWFVRRLLGQEVLVDATLKRHGDAPGGCVPSVPLALRRTPLIVTTDAKIAEVYERPDEFMSAGWKVERWGEHLLLTRLHGALSRAEVLAETRDNQWQMARAAKPGRVRYEDPIIEPEEKEIFEEGDARLEFVGVDAAGVVEYSCALIPGEHLAGFDVYYMREIVERKQLRDGTSVSTLHVVFKDRWMAESEKRPLLDVGARVFYMDAATDQDVELTD